MVRHAAGMSAKIVERAGEASIRTVFAAGSLARGDLASIEVDGVLEVYSDIDLYVVVTAEDARGRVRGIAHDVTTETQPPEGVRFVRAHDAGVYTTEELLAQPRRPGTVSLAHTHVLLHGDAGIFDELARRAGEPVDPREGLYLLENRVAELTTIPHDGDGASERFARFYDAKVAVDVALAASVAAGTYDERTGGASAGGDAPAGEAEVDEAHRGVIARAHAAMQDLDSALRGARALIERQEVLDAALSTWVRIARRYYGAGREEGVLVERRCRVGERVHNLRQFVAMQRRRGYSRPAAVLWGARLMRYAPVDALRVWALIRCMGSAPGASESAKRTLQSIRLFLDRLTTACGYHAGSVDERSRAMFGEIAS